MNKLTLTIIIFLLCFCYFTYFINFNTNDFNYISTDEDLSENIVFEANVSFFNKFSLTEQTIELIFKDIGLIDNRIPYLAVQTDLILNETNSLGESLLTTAIIKNDIDLIKLLIKKSVNLQYKNQNNKTALDLAISKDDTNIINLLQQKEFKDLTLLTNKI
jgi:ankyrin repeat protein